METILLFISFPLRHTNDASQDLLAMASKGLSLIKIIASRGLIIRAPHAPNSWAATDLWRRVFGIADEDDGSEKEEQNGAEVTPIVEDTIPPAGCATHTVNAAEIVRARQEFNRDHYRGLIQGNRPAGSENLRNSEGLAPGAAVPPPRYNVGEEYLYFAQ